MTESTQNPQPGDLGLDEVIDERWISLLDTALKIQAPLARSYVQRMRAKHPGATREELMDSLAKRFVALSTASGAGIGGVAALPGIGTVAAVGLTIGEGITFAEASAFTTLAAADIHDVDMDDPASRRLVLMAVLSGERGAGIVAKALGKQGMQWNTVLAGSGGAGGFLPGLVQRQVSRYVRRRVVSRSGKLWLGRLLPFGIGAAIGGFGARAISGSVVDALREIFAQSPVIDGELAEHHPWLEN